MRPLVLSLTIGLIAPPLLPRPGDSRLTPSHQQLLRAHLRALSLNFFEGKGPGRIKDIPRWHSANHDCAGFIRYLLWEAHEPHDTKWQERYGSHFTRQLKPLQQPPATLYAGGRAANFVPAEKMALENGRLISRDFKKAQFKTGDYLYYALKDGSHHLMLVIEGGDGSALLVYHTGAPKNELRLIRADDLLEHDSRWHPVATNPEFGGLFRFRFMD